jgi:hypothetical protein
VKGLHPYSCFITIKVTLAFKYDNKVILALISSNGPVTEAWRSDGSLSVLRVQILLGHGYLYLVSVVCSQVEVSATGSSLAQRYPSECGVSL